MPGQPLVNPNYATDRQYTFFKNDTDVSISLGDHGPTNKEIMEKLESIDRKLDLIFGDHFMLKGRFYSLNKVVPCTSEKE